MEDERYLVEGEFAFRSHLPNKLKVGMHFLTTINVGLIEPEFLYFTLHEVPEDEEMYMSLYGAPVHIGIVDAVNGKEIYADTKEVGWFNDGKEETELRPLSDEDVNTILNKYGGVMDVESDDTGDIILYDGKVIISFLEEEEEEDENRDN